ncbi:protein extra-macrochaetae [Stomoxys calcitrans]|uniref:BHLH domain-containing protein n=1 Tax=Stomoxys calcitrans TaxID=35570 RepID=A0A1I8PWS9_STOCA|nr:protein extra-macrochaetae [Stomoxys calcitrans]
MKSLTAVCQTGASMPAINPNGRISRHPPHRGDGENAEMKMYLSKLKDLVPFMPKNRKLSKLEIIQHVIDYICDLQSELETHPEINNFDATAALSFAASSLDRVTSAANVSSSSSNTNTSHDNDEEMSEHRQQEAEGEDEGDDDDNDDHELQQRLQPQSSPAQRQPLVDRQTPNTILPPASQQQQQQRQMNAVASSLQNPHHHHISSTAAVTDYSHSSASQASSTTHTLIDEKAASRQSC